MKKIFLSIITLLLTFFSVLTFVHASSKIDSLVVHYFRYDNEYSGFNIWLWENLPQAKAGKQFNFSNEDVDEYGAWVEVDLNEFDYSSTERFGIIIKKGAWGGYQEPGGDRFFNVSDMEVKNNKVHAYLVEQDLNIGVSTDDLNNNIPNYQPKILSAAFNKQLKVSAVLSHVASNVKVLEDDVVIFEDSTSSTVNLSIDLNKEISLLKKYTLVVEFESGDVFERVISIQNLYDTETFENAFTYEGDLGVIYTKEMSTFRLWAPISEKVVLNIYKQGHKDYNSKGKQNSETTTFETYDMERIENGAWEVVVNKDLANYYYTFSVTNYGITHEVTDPYSYSTGANGLRSLIVDFENTNPEGWQYNQRPDTIEKLTDYIVYELHVRDLTTHNTWNGNDDYRGKFLGFTETKTTYTNRDKVTVTTGIDHIEELGVNAVQLLPIFDFGYIDEIEMALNPNYTNTFNWGYMPYHFNTLEGSYSTNPFDGNVRINEFKQLVSSLHNKDIRVIMDVVYNHTGESESSNFHKIVPGYYHRLNESGSFSNGSGTGNEVASERLMVRKFMLDSIKFLATEYNLSGFRFDLMALHDVETMQQIENMLYEIDPTIIIYGEPWHAGDAAILDKDGGGKQNISKFTNIGAFNDTTRDAIKGSVFNQKDGAWIQGETPENFVEGIKYGIAGGTNHPQVNADKWHLSPVRTINYVSAHDNNTLYDKFRLSGIKGDKLESLQIQANLIVLTSQGIPFIHAGAEFLRSKPKTSGGYDHNSYESPDSVNQLRWDRKATYVDVFEYYKNLIAIRKIYPQFKLDNPSLITSHLNFIETNNANVIHYEITLPNLPKVVVIHVGNILGLYQAQLDSKEYRVLTDHLGSDYKGFRTSSNKHSVLMNSSAILIENSSDKTAKVKSNNVKIAVGESYNLLNNITTSSNSRVYTNSHFDIHTQGVYLINVQVIDESGNFTALTYTLTVGSGKKVVIKGEI